MRFDSLSIHGHGFYDRRTGAYLPPVFAEAAFEYPLPETGEPRLSDRGLDLKYSREENPTARCAERALAALEGAEEALAFNSGMSAIAAIYFSMLRSGDKLVVPVESYGTTVQLARDLAKFGVEVITPWPSTEAVIEAIDEKTRLVLVETMTNPTLKVIDVREVAKRCGEVGSMLVVDNTFVTPVIYRPLTDGAHVVLHSATKYLAGHNDLLAGVTAGSRETMLGEVWEWRRKLGGVLQPFEAFLLVRGLKTLSLRVERHCRNAQAVAEFLVDHPKVEEVHYPGLPDDEYHELATWLFGKRMYGGVVAFKIKGGLREVLELYKHLKLIRPSPSLGAPESLITCPAMTASRTLPPETREKLGITENLLRLAVGLEDVNDIVEDLDQALASI